MEKKRYLRPVAFAALYVMALSFQIAIAGDQSALQAPQVRLVICLPTFLGAESIAVEPLLSVSNPNESLIAVNLDYKLQVGDQVLGKCQMPRAFIPANETIEIKGAFVVPFKSWFVSEALGGKGPKGGMMAVAPLWKGLGGLRPALIKEEIWEKIPAVKAPMSASGSLIVEAGDAQQVFPFKSEWKEE